MSKTANEKKPSGREARVIELLSPLVESAGYELVSVELQQQRQSVLRIFIDYPENSAADVRIGIEDCAKVSRTLDEPLDQMTEIDQIFPSGYDLEVSSPGIERPLRLARDYERFSGKEARIHVFRPLTAEEIENPEYQMKNPRQKNFLGVLRGVKNEKVLLALETAERRSGSGRKEKEILIPLGLISKAHLEPRFEEFAKKEKE